MTAEVAILNKTAVAVAADSAVTITHGAQFSKTYDSADKIFELSDSQPLGVMMFSGMHFMGIPLQSLVREFRESASTFASVSAAANAFLDFLHTEGKKARDSLHDEAVDGKLAPLWQLIQREIQERFVHVMVSEYSDDKEHSTDEFAKYSLAALSRLTSEVLDEKLKEIEKLPSPSFKGGDSAPEFTEKYLEQLAEALKRYGGVNLSDDNFKKIITLFQLTLVRRFLSGATGLVFFGFGSGERFPSLMSFRVDGMICGRLKFIPDYSCDIDREGPKADIVPFAQRDVLDRFVDGLDAGVQKELSEYCTGAVEKITNSIIEALPVDPAFDQVKDVIRASNSTFSTQLDEEAFGAIRRDARKDIISMIEFMPKPEMAKTAEALIDLTSMKRKVSRGIETVGGPIDVAVLSKSEGFVWVKRKHYFPRELNSRYFERNRSQCNETKEL